MSDLYKTVYALDPGIADRWKRRAKDDPNHKLTASDIDEIVSPLLDGDNKISENQADAIVELMQKPSRLLKKGRCSRIIPGLER